MRAFLATTALLGVLLSTPTLGAEGFGPVQIAPAAQSFKVGTLELTALRDAQFVAPNDAKVFGVDVGPAAVAEYLKSKGLPEDRITLSVNALLVRTGHRLVLLDSGFGPKNNGQVIASLKSVGIAPESITDVVITHTHGDHFGGVVDAKGGLAFPKAVIRMASAEWAWVKSQPDAADTVKAIESHVETFTPGKAIAPGINSIALRGHTPGHVGYEIVSGGKRLLDIGDMAHSSVISLGKPGWTMGFDNDSAQAKATRKSTLTRLAKDKELVFAPHFPFPGVGHIVAEGEAFGWQPGTP